MWELPPLLWFYGPIQPIQKVPGLSLHHHPLSESIPKQQLWVCVSWGQPAHKPDSYWTLKLHRQPLHPIKGWGPWDASWDSGAPSGAVSVKAPHPAVARQPKQLHNWAGANNSTAHQLQVHFSFRWDLQQIKKCSIEKENQVLCPTEGFQSVLGRSGD